MAALRAAPRGYIDGYSSIRRDAASLSAASGMAGVGAFGWGGAYGTTYQVDVQSRSVLVLMIQLMPNATDIQQKFNSLVYQALVN